MRGILSGNGFIKSEDVIADLNRRPCFCGSSPILMIFSIVFFMLETLEAAPIWGLPPSQLVRVANAGDEAP
eukprot:s558_g15.t1